MDASRMGYSRAFGLDQWVTNIWRHVDLGDGVKTDKTPQSGCAVGLDQWVASMWRNDTRGLGVWGKKRQKTLVLWWKTCLSASENPP